MCRKELINGLVSVVLPCYNVASYLQKCVSSLCNQTYRNIEIILVDDGSTDKTFEICNKMKRMDGRVRVVRKKNGGVSSARNTGIDMARGEYIVFVDPDDRINKEMIETLMKVSQNTNADVACCGYVRSFLLFNKKCKLAYAEECLVGHEAIVKEMIRPLIFGGSTPPLSVWAKLIKRSTVIENELQFDEEWKHAEDVHFIIRLLLHSSIVAFTDATLYRYIKRVGTASLTTKYYPDWFEQRVRYRKFIDGIAEELFDINSYERKTPETILKYAYEEGARIFHHISEDEQRRYYLNKIFENEDFKKALTLYNVDCGDAPMPLDFIYSATDGFEKWFQKFNENTKK